MKLFDFSYNLLILLSIASLKIIGVVNALSLAIFLYSLKPFITHIIYKRWVLKNQFKTIQIHGPKYTVILPVVLIAFLTIYRLFFSYEEVAKHLSVSEISFISLNITFYFISNLLFSGKDTLHFNKGKLGFKTSYYETTYLWKDVSYWKMTSKHLKFYLKNTPNKAITIQLMNTPNESEIIKKLSTIKPHILNSK